MIDPKIGTDITGRGDKNGITGQEVRDQRSVEIDDRRQRVEWTLRQRALGAGTRSRRGFAGHAADELHEEFWKLQVVNRIKNGQGTEFLLRWIVAAAGQYGVDRLVNWLAQRNTSPESNPDFRQMRVAWIRQIRAKLQVPRILRRLATYDTRVRRGNKICSAAWHRRFVDKLLHRQRKLVESDCIFDYFPGVARSERLVV